MPATNPIAPLAFVKMEAIGNDFVVVENEDLRVALGARVWLRHATFDRMFDLSETATPGAAEAETGLWEADPEGVGPIAELARRICDRHTGVGADGLLVVWMSATGRPNVGMRIFNADGTEDTMCGNGLRCVIRYATERPAALREGVASTRSGPIPYTVALDGSIRLTLPPPRFEPAHIPLEPATPHTADGALLRDGFSLFPVNTGSTHSVVFVDNLPDDSVFRADSPRWEHDPAFPARSSVMWTRVDSPTRVSLRIWERGVGETLGCGTGACAAAVVARRTGRVGGDGPIEVVSRGGSVRVDWAGGDSDPIHLIGDARRVFAGTFLARG